MSASPIITNGREVDFTDVTSQKDSKARKMCAALLVQSELSADDALSVEKYVTELVVKLGVALGT